MRGLFYVVVALAAVAVLAAVLWAAWRGAVRAVASRRRARDVRARDGALWTDYIRVDAAGAWEFGVQRVAHTSAGREVLDEHVVGSAPPESPSWELEISRDKARARAAVLNRTSPATKET